MWYFILGILISVGIMVFLGMLFSKEPDPKDKEDDKD